MKTKLYLVCPTGCGLVSKLALEHMLPLASTMFCLVLNETSLKHTTFYGHMKGGVGQVKAEAHLPWASRRKSQMRADSMPRDLWCE